MAFTRQQKAYLVSHSQNHSMSKPKGSTRTKVYIHTCLAFMVLAVYTLNQKYQQGDVLGSQRRENHNKKDGLPTKPISIDGAISSSATATTVSNGDSSIFSSPPTPPKVISSQVLLSEQQGLSKHAKDLLLASAPSEATQNSKPSSQRKRPKKTKNLPDHDSVPKITALHDQHQQQERLPPLESLLAISEGKNNNNKRGNGRNSKNTNDPEIIGNVQFLLDFAVVGFGKCGTTTLLQWLQEKSETADGGTVVRAPNYEAQFLVNRRPSQLVRKMYQFGIEEEEARGAKELQPHEKFVKGFKNPSDIRRPHSRALLKQYWPETPLIVTVRHPVEWLVSIYNYFKIEKGRTKSNVTVADMLSMSPDGQRKGRDQDGNTPHFVATAKGEFHAIMAEAGKTPLAENSPEWELLQPWLDPIHAPQLRQDRLPNPIFFMEMKQLADTNTTRAQQFANDLEAFLGLPRHHLPATALHVRPNTDRIKKAVTVQTGANLATTIDQLKMDICRPEFAPVLEEMVKIARAASLWFRQYFIQSPEVTVSSPEYIEELLEAWMVDPCQKEENHVDDIKPLSSQ